MMFTILLGPFQLKPSILSALLFSALLVSNPAQAQDSSHLNLDSLENDGAFVWYDSIYTFDNMADLPIDQDADDIRVYSFDSVKVRQKAHVSHPGTFSSSCTDDYNASFAANIIWYSRTLFECIISSNMTRAAEKTRAFWQYLIKSHRTWCDCISSKYGYTSHLCEE